MKLRDLTHYENIQYNLKSLPYYQSLSESKSNFYISGGYTVALLFASRDEDLIVNQTFYDDIDFFFYTEEDYQILNNFFYTKTLEKPSELCCMSKTERATTYSISDPILKKHYKIQLIKKEFGNPIKLFQNYDIINCCLAYSFKENEIIYKSKALEIMLNKEIDLFNDYLLDETSSDFAKNLILFSYRLNKYSERYNLTLSSPLFNRIIKLLIKYKNLMVSEEIQKLVGWYNSRSTTIKKDTNVWQFYKSILYKNNMYTEYLDNFYENLGGNNNNNNENPGF